MAFEKYVMVDTSIWVDYLRSGDSKAADSLSLLLDLDRVATCGVVEMELLNGMRKKESEYFESIFKALYFLDTTRDDFINAGKMLSFLRGKGRTVPATDSLISAICLRLDIPIFSLDKHFEYIPGIKRLTDRQILS
ncbi:MAG: PIN domain-containing protein [Candidatus Sumerlaeia bacterium]